MKRIKGVYFCAERSMERVYGPDEQEQIARRLDMYPCLVTRENWKNHLDALSEAEVLVSTWGGAILNEELLQALPKLQVYFYGAGSVHELMTEAAWNRGIRIMSAADANAIPVAEFVLAQTLFSLKRGWEYMQLAKAHSPELWNVNKRVPGAYRSKVGVVSLGRIGKRVCKLLRPFDVEVMAFSMDTSAGLATQLGGVTFAPLEEIFCSCDVVSIHLPLNAETKGMIREKLLTMMKPDSTLINTSRGGVIHQSDMICFLQNRPDVYACLDVTDPEPPERGCPLYELPNVVLPPHLAGSMGQETRRLGKCVIEEIDRYLANGHLQWEITREMDQISA